MDTSEVPDNRPNAPLPGPKNQRGSSKLIVMERPEDRMRKYLVAGAIAASGAAFCAGTYYLMGADKDGDNMVRNGIMGLSGLVSTVGLYGIVNALYEDYMT